MTKWAELTCVNTPYEAPTAPEAHILSDKESVDEAASKVLARLEDLQVIPRAADERAQEEMRKRLAALGYV